MSNLFFTDDFIFDSHCHLNDAQFDEDREGCVRRATEAGVGVVLDVGVNVETSEAAVEIATRFPGSVYAVVGIDPDVFTPTSNLFDEKLSLETQVAILKRLIAQNPDTIVAIGETGMDDYWIAKSLEKGELTLSQYNQILEDQEKLFTLQLGLAAETGLPLTIHTRGAEQRCLDIVQSFPNVKGVFHGFTGGYDIAKQVLDSGWGLGVNGIVTFKNSNDLRDMYKRILGEVGEDWTAGDFYKRGVYVETDAPYLAPEGFRGQRNEPARAAEIFKFLLSL